MNFERRITAGNRNKRKRPMWPSALESGRRLGYRSIAALALFLFLAFACRAWGQLGAGSIQGRVTDPSGAVIPNATITAVDTATNLAIKSKTTSAGFYDLTPLQAGKYTVTVSAQGFQLLHQENVTVNALETVSLNLKLKLGTQQQSVTVTAAPPMLNTMNATTGVTMDNKTYSQLPIVMDADQRNATFFAYLVPGVQSNMTNGNTTDNSGVFNGSGPRGDVAEIYIDGVPMTAPGGQGDPRFVWTAIPFDAVNQFQVQTTGYSADMQGQGIENYVVKSGTNQFHGSVFEYFRNTALDTWNFFSKAKINPLTGKPTKPIEHQNEYGILLGGPIVKNKVFFFGSYDGFRYATTPNPSYATIPTLAQRTGDFTQSGLPAIYDPLSTVCTTSGVCTRTQFDGDKNGVPTLNVIPQNMISPISQFFMKELPTPTNNGIVENYLGGYPTGLSNWSTTERLDVNLSSKQRLGFVAAVGRQSTVGITESNLPMPYARAKYYIPKTYVGIISHTWTLSPTVVNQFRYAYGRYFDIDGNPQYGNKTWSTNAAGIGGLPTGQASASFPQVQFSGEDAPTQWGIDNQYETSANIFDLVDNLQWTRGRHSWDFGFMKQWLEMNYLQAAGASTPLSLQYAYYETAQYEPNSEQQNPKTGQPFASYLLGAVRGASFSQYARDETGLRFRPFSIWAQDDYHAASNLSLTLGLRYDVFPGLKEVHNVLSFFNPTATNPITGNPGILQFAGNGSDGCNCATPIHTYWQNFGPRLGLAYTFLHDTVLHAAYGIMYSHGGGVGGQFLGPNTLGFTASPSATSILSSQGGAFYLNNSSYYQAAGDANTDFPAYTPPPFLNAGYGTSFSTNTNAVSAPMTYIDPNLAARAPEFDNWNLGIQRMLTRSMMFAVTYVGAEGHFLPSSGARGYWSDQLNPKYLVLGKLLSENATATTMAEANAIIPLPNGANLPYPSFKGRVSQALLPFPQYPYVSDEYGNVANSSFNALELQIKQQSFHGLSFTINYTYSKSIDDSGTFRSGYLSNRVERSLSQADQPQNLNFYWVYDMPFGRKGTFLGRNAYLSAITRNWAFSGIARYYAGSPLAITSNNCQTPNMGQCMPDLNPAYSGVGRINGGWGSGVTDTNPRVPFIDKNAFTVPANYTIGNAPRTAPYHIFGPAYKDVDVSLRRDFHLFGPTHLLIEGDCFNLFNTVVFGGIDTRVGDSNFGEVSSQTNESRDIQLAGRVQF